MDPQTLAAINLLYLTSFSVLLFLAVIRISKRYIDYKRLNIKAPLLLHRDGVFLTGLTIPVLGSLLFRVLGIAPSEQVWYPFWAIGSGAFAVLGTLFWVWIEYFKIER